MHVFSLFSVNEIAVKQYFPCKRNMSVNCGNGSLELLIMQCKIEHIHNITENMHFGNIVKKKFVLITTETFKLSIRYLMNFIENVVKNSTL